jgi:hypothetical protein
MGLKNPIRSPHPIKDEEFDELRSIRLEALRSLDSIKRRILVPARHTIPLDIDVGKGSEIIYSAIEMIAHEDSSIIFELVEWGDGLNVAKERLRKLEEKGSVHWNSLMSRPKLKQLMTSSWCLIDQLKIPAYGAITADGLGLGLPVITRHKCENDLAFFGSCAPVENADSVETLVQKINKTLNFREAQMLQTMTTNCEWFDENLTSDICHMRRLEAYSILSKDLYHA